MHTEKELDNLINEKLDAEITSGEMPYLCKEMSNVTGRVKIFNWVKDLVIKQGFDIDAALGYIENEFFMGTED